MKNIIFAVCLLVSITAAAQEIKFGKVAKGELEQQFYPEDSTANAAYLFKERKTYFEFKKNRGFNVVNEFHYRIKIYNKEGLDYANFTIDFTDPEKGDSEKISNLKGYTFTLDDNGKIVKTKLSDKSIFRERKTKFKSVKKISMPNVKEGSVIDLQYKLTSPYTRYIDDLQFQYDIPVQKLYTKIEIPEWYFFNKLSKGYFNIQPNSYSRNGSISFSQRVRTNTRRSAGSTTSSVVRNNNIELKYNIDEYEAKNIPALEAKEPFISNINNYFGGVLYEISAMQFPNNQMKTFTNSWEDVSKKIYDRSNFGGQLNDSNYFKDDLQTLLANTKGDINKAIAIFEFVKSKVKWNSYYSKFTNKGLKQAYSDGNGNVAEINLILTAMLREAGLGANPVLVSTRNNGIPLYPTLDGFNYIISMVEFTNGSSMLLDATEPYAMPNVLPVRALNWNGRKVTKEGYSTWVNLTPQKHASVSNSLKVQISPEGTITGLLRSNEEMLNALTSRKRYNHFSKEEIIEKLEERYNIEIDNFRISNKENSYKPYGNLIKFSSDDMVENINGKLLINPLLFLTSRTNPFKSNKRTFPVDFATPWKESNNISIQLPKGYKVESIPEQLAIGLPDNLGFFKFNIINKGNAITVSSILQFNSSIIAPKYYDNLKDFYSQVITKQIEKIVLIKG